MGKPRHRVTRKARREERSVTPNPQKLRQIGLMAASNYSAAVEVKEKLLGDKKYQKVEILRTGKKRTNKDQKFTVQMFVEI